MQDTSVHNVYSVPAPWASKIYNCMKIFSRLFMARTSSSKKTLRILAIFLLGKCGIRHI